MPTARNIIRGALTFHLNRLSPGETEDADLFNRCLDALNDIADELNGVKSFLFREVRTTSSAITGRYGIIGTDWVGLSPGDEILGATVIYSTGLDVPLEPITMQQYHNIALKDVTTFPGVYAHDGYDRVYLYPAVTAKTVILLTKQVISDFADLDTVYGMPKGYQAGLSGLLAGRKAPSLIGGIPQNVLQIAQRFRRQLGSQAVNPAVIAGGDQAGGVVRIMRGY